MRGGKVKDKKDPVGTESLMSRFFVSRDISFHSSFRPVSGTCIYTQRQFRFGMEARWRVSSRRAPAQLSDSWTRWDHVEYNGVTGPRTRKKRRGKTSGQPDREVTYDAAEKNIRCPRRSPLSVNCAMDPPYRWHNVPRWKRSSVWISLEPVVSSSREFTRMIAEVSVE